MPPPPRGATRRLICSTVGRGGATIGNHTDGFNIAYADGHVSFVPTEDRSVIAALAQRVHLFEGTTPLTPAAVKAGE